MDVHDIFEDGLGFADGDGWGDGGVDDGGGCAGGVQGEKRLFAFGGLEAAGEDEQFVGEGGDEEGEFFGEPDYSVCLGEVQVVDR